MTVVLTNDDGVNAAGINWMRFALESAGFRVVVVAPDENHSGASRVATYTNPVRVELRTDSSTPTYTVAGTPVDCVRVALAGGIVPDASLVVSGINHGNNAGDDMLNSGTVGAAVEAALFGVPAIAVSQQSASGHFAIVDPPGARFDDFGHSAEYAIALAQALQDKPPLGRAILNVNVPAEKAHGVRVTRLGKRFNKRGSLPAIAEDGQSAYYLVYGTSAEPIPYEASAGTDFAALHDGFVSVTPVSYEHVPHESGDIFAWATEVVDTAVSHLERGKRDPLAAPAR